jgi:hypothetical protein
MRVAEAVTKTWRIRRADLRGSATAKSARGSETEKLRQSSKLVLTRIRDGFVGKLKDWGTGRACATLI